MARTRMRQERENLALTVACPRCGEPVGEWCSLFSSPWPWVKAQTLHLGRFVAYRNATESVSS